MKQIPLISIIIPTYNRAGLLPAAINSVLSQTYPHWELIVWDDGSSDSTRKVVQSLQDERIKYFFDCNHGMSYALNQAVRQAAGEHVAFLDDDDLWIENKLGLQLTILQDHPEIDLIFGNYQNTNLVDRKKQVGFKQNARGMNYLCKERLGNDCYLITDGLLRALTVENFIAFDSVMIRRNVLESLGPFNEKLRNGMDFEYWWRFGLSGGSPAYTEHIILERIKYPQSLSGRTLATYQNNLKTLDSCSVLSLAANRKDTIPYLNHPYRNTWQNLIPLYAQSGQWKGSLQAYNNSIKYGFRPGSVRLLLQSLGILLTRKAGKKQHA